ncbi:MAG: gliding motility-associated C-terminal domain-containing protein [Chryseobacterium sp.]|nr:gliding motility-associated C-terminal domain-containing protein [Chryseobacterium sp.]
MKIFIGKYNLKLTILLMFFTSIIYAQTCGGTFGNPIFNETFGTVNTSAQTVSPPLVAPAYTNYSYTANFPPNDGFYTVVNQSQWVPWDWLQSADHSNNPPGTYGNMLVVNASYNPGEFYRRRVSNLCSNQFYRFSTWILNLHKDGSNVIKPNVTLQIRTVTGTIIGSVNTGNISEDGLWRDFSIDFKSDVNSTQVDVVLINNSPGGIGNDLAIDDISFSPCGPSTSISADVPNIFSTGVCDNSKAFQLDANLSTNTFLNVNYIWQKSSNSGATWQDLTLPTSNPKVNIAAGTYQNNDQFRFIVGEAANILSPNCQVISTPIILKINGYPSAPVVTSPLNYCQNSPATALTATGTNLLWYTSATGGMGNTTAPVPNTSVSGTFSFYVSQTVNGCESPRSEIKVIINSNPSAPIVTSPLNYCQNSPATVLTATGTNLLWYTSATGGTGNKTAPVPNTSVSGTFSFYVSQTVNGCESSRSEIKVNIFPEPHSSILMDASICNGQTIILDVGSGFKSYEWTTMPPTFSQTLQVSKVGIYSVILTNNNGCSATQNVNVTAGITPTIVNIISTENSIEIIASGGSPPYSYSIDNQKTWQNSNVFTNLKQGIYTVYVKSQLNSCSISQETAVIFIPNVITPNDDSFNDAFKIKNIEFFPNAKIIIFNRFGKLIFQSNDIKNFTWNGTYFGRILPSGTFYYILDLGNDYKKTGWILLKDRN